MNALNLYEYAILRVVPLVEREEFINVGVVLFSKDLNYLGVKIELKKERLLSLCPTSDLEMIQKNLEAFEQIANGISGNSPIAEYIPAERFRWLTATRSTVIQCSKIHPGFCADPIEKLEQLFIDYVT